MVSSCLKNNTGFGICLLVNGSEVGPVGDTFPVGTLVEIVDWDRDESGLLTIVSHGVQKFRTVDASINEDGLLVGDVEMLPVEPPTPVPVEYKELAQLLQRALDSVGPLMEYLESDFTDAVWVSNRLTELMPLTAVDRHHLVALSDPIERLAALKGFIDQQS